MSASTGSDSTKTQPQLLAEILKWVRFQGMQIANQAITKTMAKDSDKLVYHYSDGRPSGEIAKLSGVSDFTVRAYWKTWASLGLVTPSPNYKGRYERIFSLEQFGIEVPAPKTPATTTPPAASESPPSPTLETPEPAKL